MSEREKWMEKMQASPGNSPEYDVSTVTEKKINLINGKNIIFLGSSVTYGAASMGQSFVEFLAAQDGAVPVKEAVSGTTLVLDAAEKQSYIERMKEISADQADAFICQLSTNDATKDKPLGVIADGYSAESFDLATVCGAIEYIIAYARARWNCPVYFYTGTKYSSQKYADMVELLLQIAKKWNIAVLDLWHDEKMLAVSEEDYALYMFDPIHPTKAGYLKWWLPAFEDFLIRELGRS